MPRKLFLMRFIISSIKYSFLILFITSINGQDIDNEYLPEDIETLEVYLKEINLNFIDKIKGTNSSKIKKIFRDRDEKVLKSINDSNYVFIPKLKEYLDHILLEIYTKNPQIDTTNFKFFIHNSFVPNAACYGDGMFQLNLGLLGTMESEDEVAFVICHEIAHKLLQHSINKVTNAVNTLNSSETKKKVREIKRQKYGQTRAALSVIDDFNIDFLDHSKESESQADSLGYVLYNNTKYRKYDAITSLEKLDLVDEAMLNHNIRLDSLFGFEVYPFKKYWLKETISIFDTSEKIDEFQMASDTLKTHPEIKFRVNKLKEDFGIAQDFSKKSIALLPEIKSLALKQSIKSTIDLKSLDFALYQLVEKYENDKIDANYYYSQMANLLKRIYEVKIKHELGKYVPHKNHFSSEKQLNNIRLFIHNLELNELRKIGLNFCDHYQGNISDYNALKATHDFFKSINK